MHVLLFDIDGTLIDTRGAGRAALGRALAEEFDIHDPQEVAVSGRTDRGIAQELFRLHGIDQSPENWQRFRTAYLRYLLEMLPVRAGRVLPGVEQLLEQLAPRQDVALGLLTGNVRDGARLKLEQYRLFHHFPFGGFGDHHTDRNQVAQEALEAVQGHLNGQFVAERLWVIGDTPLDVRCARWIGARVVAVATGTHEREELRATQPDLLLDDLSDPAALLQLLA